jgi:hypothetical protein
LGPAAAPTRLQRYAQRCGRAVRGYRCTRFCVTCFKGTVQLERDTGGQALQTVVSYEARRNLISQVLNQTPGQGGANVISRYEEGTGTHLYF